MKLTAYDPDHILLDDKQITFADALKEVPAEDVQSALSAAWQRQRQAFDAEIETLKVARAEIAALKAAAEVTAARTAQALNAASALLNEDDPAKIKAGVRQIIAFAQAPETARKIAEAEAEKQRIEAEIQALKSAL